jgi:hypothetical protein
MACGRGVIFLGRKTQMNAEYADFVLDTLAPLLKDIAVILAAGVAGYVGLRGLSAWRRQLAGRTEYDLARNILTALYKLRDAVKEVRNPLMLLALEPDLPEQKPEEFSEAKKTWLVWVQEYNGRWAPVRQIGSELQVNLFEPEAVLGTAFKESISGINRLIAELRWATHRFLDCRNPDFRRRMGPDDLRRQRALMYGPAGDGEEDEYSQKFNSFIEKIEMQPRPHIVDTK